MTDDNRDVGGELSPVPSLVPGTWAERVESVWQQVVLYKAFGDPDLIGAKSRRANAEESRGKAEQEASEEASALCEILRVDGEADLRYAESAKAQADELLRRAREELEEATKSSRGADNKQKRLASEAKEEARSIVEKARTEAEQKAGELRTRTAQEIERVLTNIETVRAAADEGLETRKAIAKTAGIRARSTTLRRRLRLEDLGEPLPDQAVTGSESDNGDGLGEQHVLRGASH